MKYAIAGLALLCVGIANAETLDEEIDRNYRIVQVEQRIVALEERQKNEELRRRYQESSSELSDLSAALRKPSHGIEIQADRERAIKYGELSW